MGTVSGSVTLYPSGYTGNTNVTLSNITRAYNSASNTNYATISIAQNSTGYLYFTIDTSEVPAGATITSITGTVKVRVSSTTRVINTKCQLFTGDTAKGDNVTFSSTSQSNVVTLSPGNSWTRNELNDFRLKIGGTGSSSTNSRAIYMYGASITVNYTLQTYDITIQNSTSADVQASASEVPSGGSVLISTDTLSGLTFTDNNTDVTNQFVEAQGGTLTQTAESFTVDYSIGGIVCYISQNTQGNNFNYAVGHTAENPGSTSSGSGTWTYVKTTGGSTTNGIGYAEYEFDFSQIPSNATITSMTVKCYGAVEDSSQQTSHSDITLYSGSTQKGTTQSFTSSTNSIITLSNTGNWTATELHSAILRFSVGYYGGHLFGITWTVTYTVSGYVYTITSVATNHTIVVSASGSATIYYKNNGAWVAATAVYKKVNGSWVQQTDLTNVFDSNTNYVKG